MLRVEELKEIPIFQTFRLIAGAEGLGHTIANTTILEYESDTDAFHVFHRGDFILTSLFFAKDAPELILQSFEALLNREVAAIAVKTIFYQELPEEVIRFAEQKKLPLFLFDDISMEDIIVAVDEVMKTKEAYLSDERLLEDFLNPHPETRVVDFARQLCGFVYGRYFVVCLSPVREDRSSEAVFNRLSYRQGREKGDPQIRLVKYGSRMILIYNYLAEQELEPYRATEVWLQGISENIREYRCGFSEIHTDLIRFDTALEQALTANAAARFRGSLCERYRDIDIYQFLLPLLEDKTVIAEYRRVVRTLQEYDSRYHSELFRTLQVYVKHHGKISAAAEELYQHANTIRYRLQKAEELIRTEYFYETMFLVMHLYELQTL